MAAGKASVPEVKAFFAEGESGKAITAKDLIALKRAEGVSSATPPLMTTWLMGSVTVLCPTDHLSRGARVIAPTRG